MYVVVFCYDLNSTEIMLSSDIENSDLDDFDLEDWVISSYGTNVDYMQCDFLNIQI